jgi:tetratricopeptide (TPR) repeat protein
MAAIVQAQGALQPALAFCQRSFELSTEHNRLRDGALSEMALGTIYEELENYSSALNCFGGALSKFIRMGDRKNAGDCRKRLMGVQVKLESK